MIKALLVDDEILSVKMLEKLINWDQYGIKIVDSASDGLEAIEKFKLHQPGIIITDIKMPNLNGIEFIKKVREINSEVEFIIISAYAEFSFIKDAMRFGCANYLLKPIDELELEKTLQAVVSKISDKNINKKYIEKSELMKKKQLLRDFMKNGHGAGTAVEIFNEFNKEAEPYTVMSVMMNSETINEYVGFSDLAGENVSYIPLRMEEIVSQYCNNLVFSYEEYAWIIVLFSNETAMIVKIAEAIGELFRKDLKLNAKVCFSRSSQYAPDLPKLYRQVKQLMKYCLYIDSISILGYGYNCNEDELNTIKIAALTKDMKESLNQHNTAAAFRVMEEVFRMSENISPEYLSNIYTFCFETLLTVKDILMEDGCENTGNIGFLYTTYQDITSISSMSRLRKFMNEVIHTVSSIHKTENSSFSPLVEKGIEYIKNNYNKNLSLEKICEHLSVSKNYFCSLFKRETGMNIWAYLTEVRMEKAKEFLEKTDWKSYMIAYNVGYDNPSYFTRLFRKLYNQTPGEYRENYLAGRIKK